MFGVNKDINYEKPINVVNPVGGDDKRKSINSGGDDISRGSNGINSKRQPI